MDITAIQIKALYEDNDLEPGAIAKVLFLDEAIVKASLMMSSPLYKASHEGAITNEEQPDISDEVFAQIKEAVIGTALSSDNEKLRNKTQLFLWNEKKGRNDRRVLPSVNVAISLVNERFLEMKRARVQLIEKSGTQPAIEA